MAGASECAAVGSACLRKPEGHLHALFLSHSPRLSWKPHASSPCAALPKLCLICSKPAGCYIAQQRSAARDLCGDGSDGAWKPVWGSWLALGTGAPVLMQPASWSLDKVGALGMQVAWRD